MPPKAKTRVKSKKKGGDFLGEGTYGCVLHPAPDCTSEEHQMTVKKGAIPQPTPANTIGKIFNSAEDANDEWTRSQLIAQADPDQTYFLYATSQCATTSAMIQRDASARKCRKVSMQNPNTTYPLLKMPFGGVPLSDFVMKNRVLPIEEFLAYMEHIFKGLSVLSKNGLVHQDMKFDNILVYPSEKRASIIDIGLLVHANDAFNPEKNEFIFSGYWLHPPEYRLSEAFQDPFLRTTFTKEDARASLHRHLKKLNIRFNHQERNLVELITQWVYEYCDYDHEYVEYVLSLNRHRTNAAVIESMTRRSETIDVYSVGITMVYLTQFMNPVIFQRSPAYKTLLQMCLHPNPRKRYTPVQAVKHIRAMLTTSSK